MTRIPRYLAVCALLGGCTGPGYNSYDSLFIGGSNRAFQPPANYMVASNAPIYGYEAADQRTPAQLEAETRKMAREQQESRDAHDAALRADPSTLDLPGCMTREVGMNGLSVEQALDGSCSQPMFRQMDNCVQAKERENPGEEGTADGCYHRTVAYANTIALHALRQRYW